MSINNTDIFFSVIICCYNSERYIRETIDSVISQTHKNWEIVIVNDGSTDSTEEIILNYKNKGINIIYTKQENLGFAAARNKAISIANAEWIAIIDHDDICLPDRLEIQSTQIVSNPESKLFFGNVLHFEKIDNKEITHLSKINLKKIKLNKKEIYYSLLRYGCFIDSESVVFSKIAARKINFFNNNYKFVADYDFFIRLGKIYDFNYINQTLSKWRLHKKQSTKTMKKMYVKELSILYFLNLLNFDFFIKLKFFLLIKIILNIILKKPH